MNRGRSSTQARLIRWSVQGSCLGIAVTLAIVAYTLGPETLHAVRTLPVCLPFALAGLVGGAWASLAMRIWLVARSLKHPLPYRHALAIALSTEFGVAASPGGVGGTAIRLALLRRVGVPLTAGTAMAAVDAVTDAAFFGVVTVLAVVVFLTDPQWHSILGSFHVPPSALPAALVLAAIVAVLSRGAWKAGCSPRPLQRICGRFAFLRKFRLPARLRRMRTRSRSGLRRVRRSMLLLVRRRRGILLANFCLACVQWSCRYGVLPVLLLGLGSHRNPLPLVFIQGILFSISLLLMIPGGGGIVELLSALILPLFLPKPLIGLTVLIWRFFTYYAALVVGGAVFLWTLGRWGVRIPQRALSAPDAHAPATDPTSPGNTPSAASG